jgi:site-specific recombinase XerD
MQPGRRLVDAHEKWAARASRIAGGTRRAANSAPITPHALRRAAASHRQAEGMNLREILELLGHENLESTVSYYTAVDRAELREVIPRHHPRDRFTATAPVTVPPE